MFVKLGTVNYKQSQLKLFIDGGFISAKLSQSLENFIFVARVKLPANSEKPSYSDNRWTYLPAL